MTRQRLDIAMQKRGLARSRAQAELLIDDQLVLVNGSLALKPARLVANTDAIELVETRDWRPRGYDKLDGALIDCDIKPAGMTCLDVGSSTGGFVKALLDRGASSVVAVDVGTAQLDAQLRVDARVSVYEQTDIRRFVWPISKPPDLVTVDVSFISVTKISASLRLLSGEETQLLLLIKPQFEVDREVASKYKGVIRDEDLHASVLETVLGDLGDHGLAPQRLVRSRRKGSKGNQEFFAHLFLASRYSISKHDSVVKPLIADVLGRN
jgi:23S rRNA (cytidine1920-2'-O)/16S rRNA (cytidine1409-2'-O)-methyltransferase